MRGAAYWNACGRFWPPDIEKTVQIDLLLAECYGHRGDIEHQLLAYQRAVAAAPLDYRPHLGLAGSLAALGRNDEAINEYRHITRMKPSPPAAWVSLARFMIHRNLIRPVAERQWEEVDDSSKQPGKWSKIRWRSQFWRSRFSPRRVT